jgi:hypothetical protein
LAVFCEGDYLLYQNRNAEQSRSFSPFQKFKGQRDRNFVAIRNHLWKVGEYNLALSQYQSNIIMTEFIVTKLCFFRQIYNNKLQEPDKSKTIYENYFLIMKTVFFCWS